MFHEQRHRQRFKNALGDRAEEELFDDWLSKSPHDKHVRRQRLRLFQKGLADVSRDRRASAGGLDAMRSEELASHVCQGLCMVWVAMHRQYVNGPIPSYARP